MVKGKGKFLLGALVGAGLGMLFAPKSGKELRKDLGKAFDELLDKVSQIKVEDVKEAMDDKIAELKELVNNMDSETALDIAKDTYEKIKVKGQELVNLAVTTGTPVLEETAVKLKKNAIKVAKSVIKKLEKENK